MNNTTIEKLEVVVSVYSESVHYEPASCWLKSNKYHCNPEFISLVREWTSHWIDDWSIQFSKEQHERVAVIGDWIEEHGGDRKWATSMIIDEV